MEEMDDWRIRGQKKACVVDVTRRTYEKHRRDGRTQIDAKRPYLHVVDHVWGTIRQVLMIIIATRI